MKILIVDDEALARKKLEGMLRDVLALAGAEIHSVGTATEAMESARAHRYDMAFLDIQMPMINGLQLAEHLQAGHHQPRIIFVTAHDEHAVEAFDLDVTDFITKPVSVLRLDRAIQRALRLSQPAASPRELLFERQGKTISVPVQEVWFFRADTKYTVAHTTQGEFVINTPLVELEEEYAAEFIRIHRNTLALRAALHTLRTDVVGENDDKESWTVLVGKLPDPLPVSRRQLPMVRALLKSRGIS